MSQNEAPHHSEVEFARKAFSSLNACAVRVRHYAPNLYERAFNHWYCPAVRRGYQGSMAVVFDLGITLVDPGSFGLSSAAGPSNKPRTAYIELIDQISRGHMMRLAREKILNMASDETRDQVEWLLVGSLLRSLEGVWNVENFDRPEYLPRVELIEGGQTVLVRRSFDGERLGEFTLSFEGTEPTSVTYPVLAPNSRIEEIPGKVPLLVAHIASRSPNVDDRLDYEVVEACLQGPNMLTAQHEPPPLRRTEIVRHKRSIVPGTIGGVTRAEVKLPEDPFTNIIPSELAWIAACETDTSDEEYPGYTGSQHSEMSMEDGSRADGGNDDLPPKEQVTRDKEFNRKELVAWDKIINGKPLVYKRENPRDLVPKHRALVCFLVGAGNERPPEETVDSQVHAYRHAYVYGKRQVFDLVRDLREALIEVRTHASLDVDIAVFGLRQNRGDAIVHSKFPLDEMLPRLGNSISEDRLRQTMDFNRLVSGFFDRLPAEGYLRPYRWRQKYSDQNLAIHPNVGAFLRHEVRRASPYHAIHIALIGSFRDLLTFITVTGQGSIFESRARQHLTLIAVDLSFPDTDKRTLVPGEPAWFYTRARTLSEANSILAGGRLPSISLEKLRRQFTESVMGRCKRRSSSVRQAVCLAESRP